MLISVVFKIVSSHSVANIQSNVSNVAGTDCTISQRDQDVLAMVLKLEELFATRSCIPLPFKPPCNQCKSQLHNEPQPSRTFHFLFD